MDVKLNLSIRVVVRIGFYIWGLCTLSFGALAQPTFVAEWVTRNGEPFFSLSESQRFESFVNETARTVTRFRFLVRRSTSTLDEWVLLVKDQKQRVLYRIGPKDFDGGSLWTGRIGGDVGRTLNFELQLSEAAKRSKLKVDVEEAVLFTGGGPLDVYSLDVRIKARVVDLPELKGDEAYVTATQRLGDLVGYSVVVHRQKSSPVTGTKDWLSADVGGCSGFLISPEVFLTAYHCFAKQKTDNNAFWTDACKSFFLDTSWDGDGIPSEWTCSQVAARNFDLDYVAVRVMPIGFGQGRARSLVAFPISGVAVKVGDALRVIHHPLGRQKAISDRCSIRALTGDLNGLSEDPIANSVLLIHDCPVEKGSSGAPVFDSDGKVVGMHHGGSGPFGDGLFKGYAVRIALIAEDLVKKGVISVPSN